jgi:hypothetical protein
MATYPDKFFDLVYIDASHRYEDVVLDAAQSLRVIKDDGLLIFNVYIMHYHVLQAPYGCVTSGHRYVGNVGTPNLVGPIDGEISQQIWVFTVPVVGDAGARLAPDRLVAHLPAQAVQALAVDLYAVFAL